jgi:indole-3-glycerol phosphate synthase
VNTRTSTVLGRILQSTREEVQRRKREVPLAVLEDRVAQDRAPSLGGARDGTAQRRLKGALRRPGIGVIAEFKRRSPSAGVLREDADVREVVSAYERGGADALSVLTEGPSFDGSLDDLRAARDVCDLPILRKDFIVDPYQLHEARAAGADAVLLIVAALQAQELGSLRDLARALGLDVLMEVHDREELQVALQVGADLLGINNRDLRDFSVDVTRTSLLMREVPAGVTVVSESGITTPEQLRALEQEGVHAVLVGESLMRSPDPEAALRALSARGPADLRHANLGPNL